MKLSMTYQDMLKKSNPLGVLSKKSSIEIHKRYCTPLEGFIRLWYNAKISKH